MDLEASLDGMTSNLAVFTEVVVSPLDSSIWFLVTVLIIIGSVRLIGLSFVSDESHILSVGGVDLANVFVVFLLNQDSVCSLHSR